MLRLREEGLFTAGKSKESALAGIKLGTHNENDGAYMQRKVMTIHVATNPSADETIGIGTKTYTFKASGATGDQINLGISIPLTIANIIDKINLDKDAGAQCTAYTLGDDSKFALIANVVGESPTFTADGAKIVQDIAWANLIAEAKLEDVNYYKKPLTDVDTAPIVLVEQYAGTWHNFLY